MGDADSPRFSIWTSPILKMASYFFLYTDSHCMKTLKISHLKTDFNNGLREKDFQPLCTRPLPAYLRNSWVVLVVVAGTALAKNPIPRFV